MSAKSDKTIASYTKVFQAVAANSQNGITSSKSLSTENDSHVYESFREVGAGEKLAGGNSLAGASGGDNVKIICNNDAFGLMTDDDL